MACLGPRPQWGHYYESQRQKFDLSFDLFPILPTEIRLMIWEMAFPVLTIPSRVFSFKIYKDYDGSFTFEDDDHELDSDREVYDHFYLVAGYHLRAQTLPARQISAINRETRALLCNILQDTLEFRSRYARTPGLTAKLRFRKFTDIVYLGYLSLSLFSLADTIMDLGRFRLDVYNIGWAFRRLGYVDMSLEAEFWGAWLRELPNLRTF